MLDRSAPKYVCPGEIRTVTFAFLSIFNPNLVQIRVTGVKRMLDLDVGERQGYTLDGSRVRHRGPPLQQI